MRQIYLTVFLLLSLAVVASSAAAKNPFYLTAKLGNTSFDTDPGNPFPQLIDGDDDSWGLGLGVRLGKYLAFQAEYQDLGSPAGSGPPCPPDVFCIALVQPVAAESTAISLSALPQLQLTERFFVYGKLGLASWESDVSAIEANGRRFLAELSDEDVLYGAGLRFLLPGPFGLFAEHERIADIFATTSVGVTYGF